MGVIYKVLRTVVAVCGLQAQAKARNGLNNRFLVFRVLVGSANVSNQNIGRNILMEGYITIYEVVHIIKAYGIPIYDPLIYNVNAQMIANKIMAQDFSR